MKSDLRILVTGATGMLGSTIVKTFTDKFEVYTTSSSNGLDYFTNHLVFDLGGNEYDKLMKWANPDIIIHTAALTDGNLCHEQADLAMKVNGVTSYKLAKSAPKNCRIIYISTDAVFPNDKHLACENDLPAPESTYGKSKELGEFLLLQYAKNFTIVRTTIVGLNNISSKKGFVEWIIESAQGYKPITLFDDVLFNPISTLDLSEILMRIVLEKRFENEAIHISGSEVISKYAFGISLLEGLNININTVKRGSIKDFNKRAKRSSDQSLNCGKYIETTGESLPNIETTIMQLTKEFTTKYGN